MKLVIMRHGEAHPATDVTCSADEGRTLTNKGITEVVAATDALIRYLSNQLIDPIIHDASFNIAASHLVRARQTLSLVTEQLDLTEAFNGYHLLPHDLDLAPSASPSRLLNQLDPILVKLHRANKLQDSIILLCSHRPFVDRLAGLLSADDHKSVDFLATASWVVMQGDWPVRGGLTITQSYP